MNTFKVEHPQNLIKIGLITAIDTNAEKIIPDLESRLQNLLNHRQNHALSESEEAMRATCRNMLRFGSYKPTGRSKPASEYLLKTAQEGQFPRINSLVDINNYISLKYIVPISLWDLQKAETVNYTFRPGKDGEEYVFNQTGQIISVTDLMSGFACYESEELPIVNPVKDSQKTKTDEATAQIGVAIYFPANENETWLSNALKEFKELLELSGAVVTTVQICR